MKFLDSNVVIYDELRLERKLDIKTQQIKEQSHRIIENIAKGEKVMTTTVHISETANILEEAIGMENSYEPISNLLKSENIEIKNVDRNVYMNGLEKAKEFKIGVNDGLAIVAMGNSGINEIYSFDEHFDRIEGIKRVDK